MSGSISLSNTSYSGLEIDNHVNISFVRNDDNSQPVNITYSLTTDPNNSNAVSNSDVALSSGVITLPAGADRATLRVPVTDDNLSEGTEEFVVSVIGVDSGTLLFPRTATVNIIDDEMPETPPAVPPLVSDYDVTENVVKDNLTQPVSFEFLPTNPDIMYVAEKNGKIKVINVETGSEVSTLLDLESIVNNQLDRGLMDIAVHPDVQNNPYLYAFYVVDPADTANFGGNAGADGAGNRYSHVVRYTLDASSGYTSVVGGSDVVLLGTAGQSLNDISGNGFVDSTFDVNAPDSEINPATGGFKRDYLKVDSQAHPGGALAFGPDGALYVSTGDGTSYNLADPRSVSAQNINSLSGKILRVDPLTGLGLPDNPFAGNAGGDLGANVAKVFQLGLRNPFTMGFDEDGQLFISNTGWHNLESVFTGGPGANFGWPWYEGGDNGQLLRTPGYAGFSEAQAFYAAVDAGTIEVTAPYRSFSHIDSDPGFQIQAITGADDVIDSSFGVESLRGHYIFTDVVQGEVFTVDTDDRQNVNFLYQASSPYAPVHFEQGPDGQIYYADLIQGQIGRLDIVDLNPAPPPSDPDPVTPPPDPDPVTPPSTGDAVEVSGTWDANIYTLGSENLHVTNDLGNRDRLVLEGLRMDQVAYFREGNDLVVEASTGYSARVSNHFNTADQPDNWAGTRIEDFVFTDGWVDWTSISATVRDPGTTMPDPDPDPVTPPTAPPSSPPASDATEVSGTWDADIYTLGSENLHITSDLGNRDRLVLENLRTDQVAYFREGNDLVVEASTGYNARVSDHFNTADQPDNWTGTRIEDFVFTDGWVDFTSISATVRDPGTTTPAPDPDPVTPPTTPPSSSPSPTQTLSGGWDADVYSFTGGDIAISDIGNRDRIDFGARTADTATFSQNGQALIITLDDGSVTIDGHFETAAQPDNWAGNRIEDFVFANSTQWLSFETIDVVDITGTS